MSIWSRLLGLKESDEEAEPLVILPNLDDKERSASRYALVDTEVSVKSRKVGDIGALRYDSSEYHGTSKKELNDFLSGIDYVCGHNIVHHDAKYLYGDEKVSWLWVDTLYMSPLLFPEHPYHRLVKDDKLVTEQMNNPVNDCIKARDLLLEELAKWRSLPDALQSIYATLLIGQPEFVGFMRMVEAKPDVERLLPLIQEYFDGRICANSELEAIVRHSPCELAYALALIDTTSYRSITPGWVLHNYPLVEMVIHSLRDTRCEEGCPYCRQKRDIHNNLQKFFGYKEFRTYDGEPLQQSAVQAAVDGHSLLAIFPTGGGKSLTFQLPAMMEGESVHGLTVVISPLQSLMKDQVDNLAKRGYDGAVTINGLLDPLTRTESIKRVQEGDASLLYIAPEMLRSITVQRLLLSRHVVRFVIDEAHCFSAWGQDFRVDYLYIGKFIREYQKKKNLERPIPVSCFTATAKQKVVQDICDYFQRELGTQLQLFSSSASRTNLHYSVIHVDSNEDKYSRLRSMLQENLVSTIVYVSRTKKAEELALKLSRDGLKALPYHGQMESDQKIANQESFMNNETRIIVATSAFGMGVDKSDVEMVIHYDISDSLENYVQEAGRAGRDPNLKARCYVLYGDDDLDKHFILLNQTKLSISEIQQVWTAIKKMTKERPRVCCSAFEIARSAGWDDALKEVETRVRTALSALEQAGYIERGNNVPHVYATGITVKSLEEARQLIMRSPLFDAEEKVEKAVRVMKQLISSRYKHRNEEVESRVDYLADLLEMKRTEVVSAVERMRQAGILGDSRDISAYLPDLKGNERKLHQQFERFARLEEYLLNHIPDQVTHTTEKQLNEDAIQEGITTSKEKDIRTLLFFLSIKKYVRKESKDINSLEVRCLLDKERRIVRFERRRAICTYAIDWLCQLVKEREQQDEEFKDSKLKLVKFSVIELLNDVKQKQISMFLDLSDATIEEVEEALLYLSKIEVFKLEGGFLVLYNAMDISRLKEAKNRYKVEDYRMLDEFYKQKVQQVHIVGEYANLMVHDYNAALQFVQDYFQMDYKRFIAKYFKGERAEEIQRNITRRKYEKLFGSLSKKQQEIVRDDQSRYIVVAAGPGSGKTMVLVHKLASLILLEDVKHEQLLMLTFSRAAAMEFKKRLMELIGNAAHYVEIKTFHSYCFDLMGRVGNLESAQDVVAEAAQMINQGDVEPSKICKRVLVIDEAQDMGEAEYGLVRALMQNNEDMRVIAVGDDDQNIYGFRGSSSKYMLQMARVEGCNLVEMTENYRSSRHVVNYANAFTQLLQGRLKTSTIVSMSAEDGYVEVVKHTSEFLYEPVLQSLLKHRNDRMRSCILTQKNEEALIMEALLRSRGIPCKLIQELDGFRFYNIAEVRYFLKFFNEKESPVILEDKWVEAKQKTFEKYAESSCLSYLKMCIKQFEELNAEKKYVSDLKDYIYESSIDNFCDLSGNDVVISTIHKAKGREFDDVYLLLSGVKEQNQEWLRDYYVGITRAKKRLFIHSNSFLFSSVGQPDSRPFDQQLYELPEEVELQTGLKEVNLGFYKDRNQWILRLMAGQELRYVEPYLQDLTHANVAQLSEKMKKDIAAWQEKGYAVQSARIRFIVAWKSPTAPKEAKESAILLPTLLLKRNR